MSYFEALTSQKCLLTYNLQGVGLLERPHDQMGREARARHLSSLTPAGSTPSLVLTYPPCPLLYYYLPLPMGATAAVMMIIASPQNPQKNKPTGPDFTSQVNKPSGIFASFDSPRGDKLRTKYECMRLSSWVLPLIITHGDGPLPASVKLLLSAKCKNSPEFHQTCKKFWQNPEGSSSPNLLTRPFSQLWFTAVIFYPRTKTCMR